MGSLAHHPGTKSCREGWLWTARTGKFGLAGNPGRRLNILNPLSFKGPDQAIGPLFLTGADIIFR